MECQERCCTSIWQIVLQDLHITRYFDMFKALCIMYKEKDSTVDNCTEDTIHV